MQGVVVLLELVVVGLDGFDLLDEGVEAGLELVGVAVEAFLSMRWVLSEAAG